MTSLSKLGILALVAAAIVGCQSSEPAPTPAPAGGATSAAGETPGAKGGASNVEDAMAAPPGVQTGIPGPGTKSGG